MTSKGAMSNFLQTAKTQLARFPEVAAFVVSDETGSLLESNGDIDAESLGAVHVVAVQALSRCGKVLGIGELDRCTLAGPAHACVIAPHGQEILGVYLNTAKAIGAFEKKLEIMLKP